MPQPIPRNALIVNHVVRSIAALAVDVPDRVGRYKIMIKLHARSRLPLRFHPAASCRGWAQHAMGEVDGRALAVDVELGHCETSVDEVALQLPIDVLRNGGSGVPSQLPRH
jgi:hypothetical protein